MKVSRFDDLGAQYLDDDAKPLAGGLLYFYEPGTSTDKTTYSDEAQTIPNSQPVVLDAAGRPSVSIYFDGLARGILQTSTGNQVDEADNIGSEVIESGIQPWDNDTTYGLNTLVQAGDTKYYLSIQSGNQGNDPTSPSPAWWQEARWVVEYNTNAVYSVGDIVQSVGRLYTSLTDSNQGNPVTDAANWGPLTGEVVLDATVQTGAFIAASWVRYVADTSGGGFTVTMPGSPSEGERVAFVDYSGSFSTNSLILDGGASNIMGLAETLELNISYQSVVLVYVDSTRGWVLE